MSLAARCQHAFNAQVRSKGESYVRQGAVKFKDRYPVAVVGTVRGSQFEPYHFVISWAEPETGIVASCNCPYYEGGDFCKHLWAALQKIDAEGLAASLGSSKSPLTLIHRYDFEEQQYGYSEIDDLDEDSILDHREALSAARARSNKPRANAKISARSWQTELARAPAPPRSSLLEQRPNSTEAVPGEIRYILDVTETHRTGAPTINFFRRTPKKNGDWGKFKQLKVRRDRLDEFSPEDRRRLALMLGGYSGVPWKSYYGQPGSFRDIDREASQVELLPELQEALLPELCHAGTLYWTLGADQPPEEAAPLAWDDGVPWEFRLIVEDAERSKHEWRLRGELLRGKEVASLAAPVLLLYHGLAIFPDRIARFVTPDDWRWVLSLRANNELTVPRTDRDKLLAELWTSDLIATATLPVELQLPTVQGVPRGSLRIFPAPDARKFPRYHKDNVLYAEFAYDYAGRRIDPEEPSLAVIDAEAGRALRRDRDGEQALIQQLVDLRVQPQRPLHYYNPPGNVEFPLKQFTPIIERLAQAGWHVEAEGRTIRQPGVLRATVSSGVDWFDLDVAFDFHGATAALPQLLDALQRNERFVTLDDGSQGMLPEEWLARYAPLAELATIESDRLRFRPSQALLLDALLADREQEVYLQADRKFTQLRNRLRSFAGIEPREAPAGFQGELRGYQREGLGWLAFLAEFGLGGCLADDMGLGKTVQVLAWLATRRRKRRRGEPRRPSLVVAPKSVVFNWRNEAQRFAPNLKVVDYTGLARRTRIEEIADADLVITTYGTLRQDVELLRQEEFDYVILDEAQAIKNAASVSAKSVRLLQSRHRLALSGTPVENRLDDLWSIFEFLNPGMLGRSAALQSFARSGGADDAALQSLRRGMAPFILRRTKEEVLKDLPAKTEQTIQVELLPADRKRYNELRDHYRASLLKRVADGGMNSARMHVLEALLRLRQAACHPGLLDKKLVGKPSAKLDALLEQVAEVVAEGHKALVFSQFTSLLSIVRTQLDARGLAYEYLDGCTRNRQERVERFQTNPDCPLFLVSLKAGGTGLNLTAADYVFLLDPWWNPAVEAQAIDRAHRLGQQRPVFAYRLVAQETVEEKIIELQQKKRRLADAIITGERGALAGLTAEDLESLLS